MALTWTSAADVTSRWVGGEEIPATTEQISALLEDAEDTLLGEFPTIVVGTVGSTPEGAVPLRRVQKVLARVVIRHLRNPGGVRTHQKGAGPYQDTITYGGNEPGALFLTDEDRSELGLSRQGSAFTINSMPADTQAGIASPDHGTEPYDSIIWEPRR